VTEDQRAPLRVVVMVLTVSVSIEVVLVHITVALLSGSEASLTQL
jgi:hypothetical protein